MIVSSDEHVPTDTFVKTDEIREDFSSLHCESDFCHLSPPATPVTTLTRPLFHHGFMGSSLLLSHVCGKL